MKKKVIKICWLALGVVILFGIIQARVLIMGRNFYLESETIPKADVVIVFGAFVSSSGRLSLILEDRLKHALELYDKGIVPKILVSGDHGQKEYNEVKAMCNYLLDKGVKAEDIFMDHAGFTSYSTLYRARDVFKVEKAILSTQQFHMYRCLYIAKVLGIESVGYAVKNKRAYRMAQNHIRERLARIKAFIQAEILRSKPKFLGDAIPISGGDGRLTQDE